MTLSLVGPYPSEVPELIRERLPLNMQLREIKDQEALDVARDLEYVILRTLRLMHILLKIIQIYSLSNAGEPAMTVLI